MTSSFSPFESSAIVDRAPDFRGVSLPAELLSAARRAGASIRHRQRVGAAQFAALGAARYVLGIPCEESPDYRDLGTSFMVYWGLPVVALAWCLLRLEMLGTGGTGGIGGSGDRRTLRSYWASSWGAGRAHAGDGPAWDEALRCASLSWEESRGHLVILDNGNLSVQVTDADHSGVLDLERLSEVLGPDFSRSLGVRVLLASDVHQQAPCGESHPWAGDGQGVSICGSLDGMALAASRLWSLGGGEVGV